MPVICHDIITCLENKYPRSSAEDFDNVGLLVGDPGKTVSRVLVCLDINVDVVREARDNHIDMIIAHHPVIFSPLKAVTRNDYIGSMIMKLIKNDISVYVLHTNFDNSADGMNDILAKKLGLNNIKPLANSKPGNLLKFAVYVPKSHETIVREALLDAGAGCIGNYSHCSFNISGTGTFMPHAGTSPFIGEEGRLEEVSEVKIETILKEEELSEILDATLKAHPYEEVAYDIYPLVNTIANGSGRLGTLSYAMTFMEFCSYVKESLNIPYVNAAGNMEKLIQRVAVIGGSGEDFISEAVKNECDVIVTGDIRHHHALDGIASGINIIDGGHYFTEVVALPYIAQYIMSSFDVECSMTKINTNPFQRV